jgi:hypothetical protein
MNDRPPIAEDFEELLGQVGHVFDAVEAGDLRSVGILRTQFRAGKSFQTYVVRREKKNFGVGAGRNILFGLGRWGDDQGDSRLRHPGEVIEVVVLAKTVLGVCARQRSEENDYASSFLRESFTAGVVIGTGLTIEGEC